MTEKLAEGWQEHDEVKALIKSATEEAITNEKKETKGLVKNRDDLLVELKDLKKKAELFRDLDPEKAREALEKVRELDDQQLIDAGKIEELLTQRTERMKGDFETQTKKLTDTIDVLKGELGTKDSALSKSIIEKDIREAVLTAGKVFNEAWSDVIHRGMQVFKINDKGAAEPRDKDGKLLYGKDGQSPLTFKEWAESLRESAPYIWDEDIPGGAGSSGNKTAGEKGTVISISKEDSKDVVKYRAARKKAAEAGISLQIT